MEAPRGVGLAFIAAGNGAGAGAGAGTGGLWIRKTTASRGHVGGPHRENAVRNGCFYFWRAPSPWEGH
jgi:hypothetical protein